MKLQLIATLLAAATLLPAATIISTNGTPNTSYNFGPNQVILIQFILPVEYTNVAISAALVSFSSVETGTAYLTNQIGPGTTIVDNQIAATNFNTVLVPSVSTLVDVPLFSGLTLGAGTYNLVLTAPSFTSAIEGNTGGGYTTDSGIVVNTSSASGSDIRGYHPASFFSPFGFMGPLYFTVTGDSTVPEPSSIALLLTGAGALLWKRRRSRA